MVTILLTLAVLGQRCGPSGCSPSFLSSPSYYSSPSYAPSYGPASFPGYDSGVFVTPVYPTPQAPSIVPAISVAEPKAGKRKWLWGQPGGKPGWVWGWRDDRQQIWYYADEQPEDIPPSLEIEAKRPANPLGKAPGVPPVKPPDLPRANTPPARPNASDEIEGDENVKQPVVGQFVSQPTPKAQAPADWMTKGVSPDKLRPGERFHTGGSPDATRFVEHVQEEQKGIRGDDLDMTGKMFVSVISADKAMRESVAKQIRDDPELAPNRDKLLVRDFRPDAWQVAGFPYAGNGQPTIIVQDTGGSVKHRQMDFSGGVPKLAEAIRKIDPNYDPKRDADLRNGPKLPAFLTDENLPWWIIGVGGVLLIVIGLGQNRGGPTRP